MQYIVIELQTNNANGTVGNLVYAYADRNEAERKYHLILADAAVSTINVHAAVLMTNEGQVLMNSVYYHPDETPEGASEQ